LIQSISILAAGIFQPKFGRYLDQGKLGLVAVVTLLSIICGSGLLVPQHLPIQIAVFAVLSFSFGFALVMTLITRCLEAAIDLPLRPKAVSLSYLFQNTGMGIAAFLAFLFLRDHRSFLLIADGLTTALLCLGIFFVLHQRGESSPPVLSDVRGPNTGWGWIRRFPAFPCFLLYILTSAPKTAIPMIFYLNGLPLEKMVALSLGINTATVVLVTLLVSRGFFRLSPINKLYLSVGCLAIGLALLTMCHTVLLVTLVTILWSAGEAIGIPPSYVVILNGFTAEEKGLSSGVKIFLIRAAQVTAPAIAAALFHFPIWTFAAGFLLIGLLTQLLFFRAFSSQRSVTGIPIAGNWSL
jgi:hypothetical protein